MLQQTVPVKTKKEIKLSKCFVGMQEKNDCAVTDFSKTSVRAGWGEAFTKMHKAGDDVLIYTPSSDSFDWEW